MKKIILPLLMVTALAVLSACASGGSTGGVKFRFTDYYPLKVGNTWTYRATSFGDTNESAILTAKVTGEKGGVYTIAQGQGTFSYTYDKFGLMKVKSRAYLLKDPIVSGATWQVTIEGMQGTAKVIEAGVKIDVPAGTYESCAIIEEVFAGITKLVSSYCPGVGLVRLEEYSLARSSADLVTKVELLAYMKE